MSDLTITVSEPIGGTFTIDGHTFPFNATKEEVEATLCNRKRRGVDWIVIETGIADESTVKQLPAEIPIQRMESK